MEGLVVRPERMLPNLTRRTAWPSPAACCWRWSRRACPARPPTRIVQRNAMRAWETDEQLRDLLAADPDAAAVPASVLDEAFDLADFLRHARRPLRTSAAGARSRSMSDA